MKILFSEKGCQKYGKRKERATNMGAQTTKTFMKEAPNHAVDGAHCSHYFFYPARLGAFWEVPLLLLIRFTSKFVALGTMLAPLVRFSLHVVRLGHKFGLTLLNFGTLFTQLSSGFGTIRTQHLQKDADRGHR